MEQDWKPVVFTKNISNSVSKNKTQSKNKTPQIHSKLQKIDRTEIEKIPTIKLSVAKAISKRRTELKIPQKKLAQLINVKPDVINQYESGKAIPKQHILIHMERHLGVCLRGQRVGELLNKNKS